MDPFATWKERRGALSDLARHLGITPAAISHWRQVPATRARAVSEFTGIPLHELRPDVFGSPEDAARQFSGANQGSATGADLPPATEAA
jgi:DNA-binding transcriptional regulator YdaS (Cro superfamily)